MAPRLSGSTGTSRQPSTERFSSAAICSIRWRVLATCSSSPGRNAGADGVLAGAGQVEVHDLAQERVRHLHEDAGAVTGVRLGARGAAVLEVAERGQRLRHDVVAGHAGQGRDEGHATGVVLVGAVVEPLRSRRLEKLGRAAGAGGGNACMGILPSSSAPPRETGTANWQKQGIALLCRGRRWPARWINLAPRVPRGRWLTDW